MSGTVCGGPDLRRKTVIRFVLRDYIYFIPGRKTVTDFLNPNISAR
ncbi:MAG: hypothetical protein K0S39_3397 [Paenibacillus sp.]|jgi:hypothetical protein|nr:hypothetical protein [Paenibacillus sp.]